MVWSSQRLAWPAALATVATILSMTMMNPGVVHGETRVVPSLSVSERYDSNVFFIPGTKLEDYVTNVSPQVRVDHKGRLIDGTVLGGVIAEAYVKNPGLNYVATNGSLDLNLDQAAAEVVRGMGLRLSDTFYFTPQPPAFAAPVAGSQVSEAFVRGIQARRANSFSNSGNVTGSYALSPVVSFQSIYMNQRIRFGNVFIAPTGPTTKLFIDTTFQTVQSGPELKVSPLDTLTLSHQYQQAEFSFGGSGSGFKTQGATLGWTRLVSPILKASMAGGFTVFESGKNVQYVGTASLEWKLQNTDATVSYSRRVYPSFIFVAVPLLSQVLTATVRHRLTEPLTISVNGSYAKNESVPDPVLSFTSYSAMVGLEYKITRSVNATMSYSHSKFEQKFFDQSFPFERNMAMLKITAEWN